MMALDPDVEKDPAPLPQDDGSVAFPPIDADLAEAKKTIVDDVAFENAELKSDGKAPPTGWRRDAFGSTDVVRRVVWAPPWSLRPPSLEPEAWLCFSRKSKDQARLEWKTSDPAGYAEQEKRRADFQKAKLSGKVAKAVAAVPLLCRDPGGNSYGYDTKPHDHVDENDDTNATTRLNDTMTFTDCAPAQLLKQVSRVIAAKQCDRIFFELCCDASSNLTANVPEGTCAIRVTENTDLTSDKAYRVLRDLVKKAAAKDIPIFVWASVPCTSGCPWKYINSKLGRQTGDAKKTNTLIQHAVKLCKLAAGFGGKVCWEWPVRCDLWHDPRVYDMALTIKGKFVSVSTSAAGLSFRKLGKEVHIKKRWCIMSNDASLVEGLSSLSEDAREGQKSFVECRGRIAKSSANYTRLLAQTVWKTWVPTTTTTTTSRHDDDTTHNDDDATRNGNDNDRRRTTTRSLPALVAKTNHRSHDQVPLRPLWCSLVTRIVKPKSSEAQCEGAREAMRKELGNIESKGVWDTNDVYSLTDLLRDTKIKEAMLGRAFAILGVKNEELDVKDQKWKARIVFQGSNIRTKSGTSATELFEDVANSPASFAAARAALGVAALRKFQATLRDADAAYLQAMMDIDGRTPTFVELPKEWWPDSWFYDGAERQRPKYIRPHCRLKRALYGHPEAGALWEKTLKEIMSKQGWEQIPMQPGVFCHKKSGATMVVYVDDLLLIASPSWTNSLWRALEKKVCFKDPEEPIGRYLGAKYCMTNYDETKSDAIRDITIGMHEYALNATARFKEELGRELPRVTSPYITPEEWSKEGEAGAFQSSCASHVATLLFLSRVARPDIAVAVQRLCKMVTRWTTVHDLALIRLFAYLQSAGKVVLTSALSPQDLGDIEIHLWCDADWAGDAEDTKSTSGMLLELKSPSSGRSWVLSWAVRKQTATASSTAEAETATLCHYLKHEALPMLSLVEALLRNTTGTTTTIPLIAKVDNTQCIQAVHKGYSKKLRFLERTHRCSISAVHELVTSGAIQVEHAPTLTHKADGFTNMLTPSKFVTAREMMGIRQVV